MDFKMKILVLVTFYFKYCVAASLDELKQKYVNYILECSQTYPITAADVLQLKNKELPDNQSIKCLLACAYKKTGMTDQNGNLSIEGIRKTIQEYYSDEPEKMKLAEQFTDACKQVNDVEVTGDKKECERAALIYKCSLEQETQFDFV